MAIRDSLVSVDQVGRPERPQAHGRDLDAQQTTVTGH